MESSNVHIGKKVKELFNDQNLTDLRIIKETEIDQAYLSKVYTSKTIQPWQLKRFLYKINREFDLDISPELLYEAV